MEQNSQSSKVVIVEDNVSLADIYKIRLESLGYTCFAAFDGREALEIIERELPDLVLLDLMVPKIAGDQILETMRASEWGKMIKVLVISNLNEADAPAGLREHGIEGYAVKANLSNDQLDQLVDRILKPVDQEEDVELESNELQVTHAPLSAIEQAADLTVTATIHASVDDVWTAWATPSQLQTWWGPDGFTCPSAVLNIYPGGLSVVAMTAPAELGGGTSHSSWACTRADLNERFDFIHNLSDAAGTKIDPTSIGLPADFPQGIRYEVVFVAQADSQTQLSVTEYGWSVGHLRDMSKLGMEQSLVKLDRMLTSRG